MKKWITLSISICLFFNLVEAQSLSDAFPKTFTITISNPLTVQREEVMVNISDDQLKKLAGNFNPSAFVVLDGKTEIASQYNQYDKANGGIVFVVSKMNPKETRAITVRYAVKGVNKRSYDKRTQAELSHKVGGKFVNREYVGGEFKNVDYLRVPPEHKDHSWFIRYEGPGWESDKVGYRFYLDQRNASDVFGKKTTDMVLQNVGLDGFDSYHELQPWGMDVMKVGKSLGIGSIGAITGRHVIRVEKTDSLTSSILENGPVYSSISTNYYGWQIGNKKINVESLISIHAGTRLTHEQLTITGDYDSLCTGIVKDKLAMLYSDKGDAQHWGYLATYGKQSLNNDQLGLAVFFKPQQVLEFTTDEFSHVVALKPENHHLEYYFLAAWQLEPNGITTEAEFINYIKRVAHELGAPVNSAQK